MGKKAFDVVLEEGKMGLSLLEGGADEIDCVVRVLGLGEKMVKWVGDWFGGRVWDRLQC